MPSHLARDPHSALGTIQEPPHPKCGVLPVELAEYMHPSLVTIQALPIQSRVFCQHKLPGSSAVRSRSTMCPRTELNCHVSITLSTGSEPEAIRGRRFPTEVLCH